MGAPIFNSGGNVAGSASLQLNPESIDEEEIEKKAARLLRTTWQISINLGHQPISVRPHSS